MARSKGRKFPFYEETSKLHVRNKRVLVRRRTDENVHLLEELGGGAKTRGAAAKRENPVGICRILLSYLVNTARTCPERPTNFLNLKVSNWPGG